MFSTLMQHHPVTLVCDIQQPRTELSLRERLGIDQSSPLIAYAFHRLATLHLPHGANSSPTSIHNPRVNSLTVLISSTGYHNAAECSRGLAQARHKQGRLRPWKLQVRAGVGWLWGGTSPTTAVSAP
jgi:hypothetical protein